MRNRIAFAGLLVAGAMMTTGCEELLSDFNWDAFGGDWITDAQSALEITDAFVGGNLGNTVNLPEGSARIEPGFDSVGYTTFNLVNETADGTLMQIVEVDGGLDHPDLQEPGTVYTNDCDAPREPSDPPMMRVTGCGASDPNGGWDYDEGCQESTVEVEEDPEGDPDVLMYTVTTQFARDSWGLDDTDTTEVVSRFRVRRRPVEEQPQSSASLTDIDGWVNNLIQRR